MPEDAFNGRYFAASAPLRDITMHMRIALAGLVMLAGCNTIQSAGEITSGSAPSVHAAKRAPEQAAGCMARNAESEHSLVASTRAAEKPGAYEVLVRTGVTNILAYAVAEPADSGSKVSVWLDPMPFWRKSEITANMLKGC